MPAVFNAVDELTRDKETLVQVNDILVKPGNPIGEPFTKKNLDEYDLYDPSKVYYDVMY